MNVNARQRVDLVLAGGRGHRIGGSDGRRGRARNRLQFAQPVDQHPGRGGTAAQRPLLFRPRAAHHRRAEGPGPTGGREGAFIVNGLRSTYNNYLLDGVDNNAYGTSNQGFANQVAQPSPDAVAEFKVITNNYSAEYGRSGGATIDVAMRSGTNQLHGTLYEFLRNTDLNAVGYIFGHAALHLHQAHPAAESVRLTIGGPSDQEPRLLLRRLRRLPLPAAHQYLLQHSLAQRSPGHSAGRRHQSADRRHLSGQHADPGRARPRRSRARCWPNSRRSPYAGNTVRSNNLQLLALNRTYTDKFDAKLDGQINERMNGFLRISQRKLNNYNQPGISGPSGGGGNGFIRALNQQATAAYTWTVNRNSILEGRFAVSRTNAGKTPPYIGGASMLDLYGITGLPTTSELTGGLTPQTLSGFTQLGRQATNPQFQNPLSFNYKVNFTKNMGRHALKTGFEYVVIRTQVLDVNPALRPGFLRRRLQPARGRPRRCDQLLDRRLPLRPAQRLPAGHQRRRQLPPARILRLLCRTISASTTR